MSTSVRKNGPIFDRHVIMPICVSRYLLSSALVCKRIKKIVWSCSSCSDQLVIYVRQQLWVLCLAPWGGNYLSRAERNNLLTFTCLMNVNNIIKCALVQAAWDRRKQVGDGINFRLQLPFAVHHASFVML